MHRTLFVVGLVIGLMKLSPVVPSVPDLDCSAVAIVEPVAPPAEVKQEKKSYHKGRIHPKNLEQLRAHAALRHAGVRERLPKATAASYDCRTLGLVPPIKDQGQCGSCWDFSGTGVVESALIKAGYGKADGSFVLSEQYTLDCGKNGGCDGDDNTTVLAWAKATGLPLSNDYGPYTASAGRCKSTSKLLKIGDWGFAGAQNGVTAVQDIKNAMVAYGPIGCAIAADDAFMNNPPGTVFDRTTSTGIDHDVILVGWDDSKGKNGAWLLRNSWGSSWCDGGYCWIGYGVNEVGTEAVWASAVPIIPPTPPTPNPPTPPAPVAGAPAITSPLSANAVLNTPFTYQITATNSPTVFSATGLPAGLAVSSTGLISGMATVGGPSAVTVFAANGSGAGFAQVTITVTATPVPPTNPVSLALTPEQVQSVITQSGVVVIRGDMSLSELSEALIRCKEQLKPKPCCGNGPVEKTP